MQTLPYADPGTPDLRSPLRFLGWVAAAQWRTLLAATSFGVLWMVSQALFPAAVQRAIDEGIIAGDSGRLLLWGGVLLLLGAVGAVTGALRHRFAVTNWLAAAFRGMQLVGYKTADTGQALPRTMPTGEVVATVASDAMRVGGLYDVMRPVRRRHRQLRRRRRPAARRLDGRSAWSCWSACRCWSPPCR